MTVHWSARIRLWAAYDPAGRQISYRATEAEAAKLAAAHALPKIVVPPPVVDGRRRGPGYIGRPRPEDDGDLD